MERHAFCAQLNHGYQERYVEAHRNMPRELVAAYRAAGISNLFIFRRESMLFLYLECEGLNAAMAALEDNPLELRWQKLINPMLKEGDFHKMEGVFEMP